MVIFFWLLFFVFLAGIMVFTAKRFEPKTAYKLKIAIFIIMGFIGLLSLVGFYRYTAGLPEEQRITADTTVDRRLKIASSPYIAPAHAKYLSQDADRTVRYELAANQALDEDIMRILMNDPDPNVRKRLSRNLTVPLDLIESQSMKEGDPIVRQAYADALFFRKKRAADKKSGVVLDVDPRVRITEALEKLSPDSEDYRKIRLSTSGKPFLYSIDMLASDINPDVRYAAASNTSMSGTVLRELQKDPDKGVQEMAILTMSRKDSTDADSLETFSLHTNTYIREAVANNPHTPSYILEQLSRDGHKQVLLAVAGNEKTPSHILSKLAGMKDVEILRRIARHSTTPESALRDLALHDDPEVRRRVALNANAPDNALERLGRDNTAEVRVATSMNMSSSPVLLARLAGDPEVRVRAAVAMNPSTPVEVVKDLAKDKAPQVRLPAEHNLRNFAETLRNLGKDNDVFRRRQVAQNLNTPPATLAELAGDEDVYVRERVALNPNTTREVLSRLSRDSAEQVRLAVAENPNRP